MKYFKSSIYVTIIGLVLAYFIGGFQSGLVIAAILAILEVSLSFDNAVVNAKILQTMDSVWKQRFITWGMAIAVFGMRLLFPLVIVGFAANINPFDALMLAVENPNEYKHHLEKSHVSIMGFGGSFLLLVSLKYFIDETKDVHWIGFVERQLIKLGKIEAIQVAITLGLSLGFFNIIKENHGNDDAIKFLISSIMGIVVYIASDGIGALLESEDEINVVQKSGIASFMYLELLDASFSFDGVVGAFALTNSLFIIAIGLGIGAMFVRSLTLMLVDKGTLNEYRFLEHAAFYAILTLAITMFINTIYEISEVFTGLIGAVIIIIGLISSIYYNKKLLTA